MELSTNMNVEYLMDSSKPPTSWRLPISWVNLCSVFLKHRKQIIWHCGNCLLGCKILVHSVALPVVHLSPDHFSFQRSELIWDPMCPPKLACTFMKHFSVKFKIKLKILKIAHPMLELLVCQISLLFSQTSYLIVPLTLVSTYSDAVGCKQQIARGTQIRIQLRNFFFNSC